MASLIIDARDQKFVLYEMLKVEDLCQTVKYADFSRETFDMVLAEAEKLGTEVLFPTLVEGDRVGCKLENGEVVINFGKKKGESLKNLVRNDPGFLRWILKSDFSCSGHEKNKSEINMR